MVGNNLTRCPNYIEGHDKEPLTPNYPQPPVLKWLSYRGTPPPPIVCKIHRMSTFKGVGKGVGLRPDGAPQGAAHS